MNMNLDLKNIGGSLSKLPKKLLRYSGFIAIILVLAAYGFIVFQIGSLTSKEPDEEVVAEKLKTLKKPHVDEATIIKIQQLEDTNVQVKALFDQARDNPFQD